MNRKKPKPKKLQCTYFFEKRPASDTSPVGLWRVRGPACGIAGKFHDDIFDMIRIGDLAEDKVVLFAGGLYAYVAEVEYRGNDAFDGYGDILDAGKVELTYFSDKQSFLLDVDDAVASDDPDIEIIIDPCEETEEPHKNEESVFNKDKEARTFRSHYFREKDGEKKRARDEKEREKEDDKEMSQDVEPVAMDDKENFFIVALSLEVTLIESVRHKAFQ
jgi:hypothetical protein